MEEWKKESRHESLRKGHCRTFSELPWNSRYKGTPLQGARLHEHGPLLIIAHPLTHTPLPAPLRRVSAATCSCSQRPAAAPPRPRSWIY